MMDPTCIIHNSEGNCPSVPIWLAQLRTDDRRLSDQSYSDRIREPGPFLFKVVCEAVKS